MIDFEKIVTQLLQEYWEENLDFLVEATGILDPTNGLFPIHIKPRLTSTTKSIKDNLSAAYSSYGLPVNIPADNILISAIQTLQGNTRGTGKKAKDFVGVAEWLPILDLIAMLMGEWPTLSAPGKTIDDSKLTYEAWEKHLEQNHGFAPALYKPYSPAGFTIARDLTNKTDLGTLRVKDLTTKSPKITLFALAKKLFDIRKQSKFTFLPRAIVQKFDLEGDKILNHIMYNPWELTQGTYPISKELAEIYDHGIINMLVDVSTSMHRLYQAELNKITVYAANNTSTPMSSAALNTLNEFPKKITNNKDYYALFVGSENTQEAIVIDYQKWIQSVSTLTFTPTSGTLTDIPPFKVDDKTQNLNYLYNAETLTNAAVGDYKEAKLVIEELEQVANYITQKEAGQKLDGATQMAKGLTLGAVPA
jgi:hypothetical protein